jgi:hypothetical protein
MVTAKADRVLSLSRDIGGSLQLAESFTPEAEVVVVAGDTDPRLETELLLCAECYARGRSLAELVERRNTATSRTLPDPPAA